ncbi:hypothetical protein GUITHDRAFT_119241 [Guillardia theta CCMP2712]|uniref:Uncharacterized protein n=1 Tax=Guillardia theta (strain CCMP2712) TaxID=905079 RepID=L1IE94_GUITC|nr:hypothetical protein GUITHDRAFT_119241 [Guillardia theta CCMP2712]EKX34591.1 hypothetical protein GUITHDRAFT_119241 [Guillardia theta CCMP2712]|eukprot:XP_005821571.1 hypothetical protein GUITHDRAFT_119241 [Guillardia theta CCMP2712]
MTVICNHPTILTMEAGGTNKNQPGTSAISHTFQLDHEISRPSIDSLGALKPNIAAHRDYLYREQVHGKSIDRHGNLQRPASVDDLPLWSIEI